MVGDEGGWLERNMEQEEGGKRRRDKRLAEGGSVRDVRIHNILWTVLLFSLQGFMAFVMFPFSLCQFRPLEFLLLSHTEQ